MAGNYTIPVDVELRTKQQNVKNLRSAIENEFRDIDFNSSIGKQLNKLFGQFDTKISDMDSILGKGILDMGDLNKLNGIFNRMNLIVGQMRSSAHKAPLVDLGIDAQSVPELVEARNLVKQITSEMAKQKAVSTKDRLKQAGQQDLLDDLNKIQKTRAHENKPLGVNAKIIQEELAEAEHLIQQHYEKRDQLDKQYQEKSAKAKQSQKILDDAEADYVKNAQKASLKQIMALETAAGKKGKKSTLESQFGGGNKLSQKSAQKFLDEFMVEAGMAFEGTQISGTLTQKLWEGMFTENEITQMQQAGGDMGEALYAGLEQKLLDPAGRERFRQIVHDFSKEATGSAEGYTNTADNIKKNLPNLMNQAKADAVEVQAIEQSQIDNENVIATLEPQIASFKAVVDRLASAASTLETVIQNKYQKELNEANRAAEQAKANAVDQKFSTTANAQVSNQPIPQYQQQGVQAQEAEKFKANLQQSIKQWMGTREIINYVKQGIRQAYQDIQGLDKAMTNIAVVTNMSTSDLWGKINEYMGVAQQYGVTTQGVYEVSQLYFQQGLGESDVMAATTETLKMARIAGMDYAEAADGMTVAIRGFNMEMQDAAHVTDVYSKVAAVTASDTQELVTAMSKTASSAAAVGSSFENTTAMLAVMIEATRESPQNLGSALKSIISRYGEMTQGLSEDSEGEEIDYNRVDAALKTVGISLKDAQGQFRDFDTVIEELSAKWDTLDSVTQRYIATIFAGNRQQSRFLALVSNHDRYMEVKDAAENSEDAGLLQYSKTLDSLETKLNNISTSFQQFYMGIFNGPLVGKGLDFINNLIKGFNQLGKLASATTILSIITGLKSVGNLLVSVFSSSFSSLGSSFASRLSGLTITAQDEGAKAGAAYKLSFDKAASGQGGTGGQKGGMFAKGTKGNMIASTALSTVGMGISAYGASVAGKGGSANIKKGAIASMAGNTLSGAAMGLQLAGPLGAAIGAIAGLAASLPAMIKAFDKNNQRQADYEKKKQITEESNIKRAEAKQNYTDLKNGIDKVNELDKIKHDSQENYQAWLDANNSLVEAYPSLLGYIDEAGNTIADLSNSAELLSHSMTQAAEASRDYYVNKIQEIEAGLTNNQDYSFKIRKGDTDGRQVAVAQDAATSRIYFGGTDVATQGGGIKGTDFTVGQMIAQMNRLKGTDFEWDINDIVAEAQIGEFSSQTNSEIYQALKDAGAVTKNEETGKISLEQHVLDYLKAEQQLQEIYGTKQAAMQTGISLASMSSTKDDDIQSISGFTSLMVKMGQEQGAEDFSYLDLANLSTEAYEAMVGPFVTFYNSLNGIKQKDFQSFSENLSGYSYDQLIAQLEGFGLSSAEDSTTKDLYNAYVQRWRDQNYTTQQKLVNSIWAEDNILSYSQWQQQVAAPQGGASEGDTEEQKREKYQKWVEAQTAQYSRLNSALFDTLFEVNEEGRGYELKIGSDQAESLTTFMAQQEKITTESINTYVIDAANARKETLALYYAQLSQIDFSQSNWRHSELLSNVSESLGLDLTNWGSEDIVSLQNLLIDQDAGGMEWQEKLDSLAQTYRQTIDWNGAIGDTLFTPASTKLNYFTEKMGSITEGAADLSEKQEKGFDFEDTTSLLKKLRRSDWNNVFEYTQDGLIVLKNYEETIEELYGDKIDQFSGLTDEINRFKQTSLGQTESQLEKVAKTIQNAAGQGVDYTDQEGANDLTTYLDQLSISDSLASEILTWAQTTKEYTSNSLMEYLNTLAEISSEAADFLSQTIEKNKQETAFKDYIRDNYEGVETLQNVLESPSLEAIKDYAITTGKIEQYKDAEGNYEWERYFDDLEGDSAKGFNISEFGTVTVTDATAAVEALTGKSAEEFDTAENLLVDLFTQNLTQTLEGVSEEVRSLATQFHGGENIDISDVQNAFSSFLGEEVSAENWAQLLLAITSGSFELFSNTIKNIRPETKDSEIETMWGDYTEGVTVGTWEYTSKLIENQEKVIKGEFSAADLADMEDGALKDAIKAFMENTSEQFSNYAQTVALAYANKRLTFDDASSYLTSGYEAEFDKVFGFETDIASTLAETDSWDRGTAAKFLGQLNTLTGDSYSLQEWFQQRADGTFKLIKTEEELLAELSQIDDEVARQQIEDSYRFLKDWTTETKKESAFSELEGLATQSEFTASEIRDFYSTQLNEILTVAQAKDIARNLEALDPMARLNEWVRMYQSAGIDIDQDKYQQLVSLVLDSIIETISSGLSQLGSGIDGTLSFSDFTALQQKYGLSGRGATQSSRGVTLGKEDQQTLISELYKTAEQQGLQGEFGDQLWQTWLDSEDSTIEGYQDIEDAIANCYDSQGNLNGATQEYVEALKQARHSAMFDENAYEFAFMEQDATSGLTKNFDKFASQIDKVKEAFTSFQNDEAIGYQDFYNMMDFIGNSEAGFAKFSEMTGIAASDYDAFINSVIANTDEWGKVDIGGVAAEMGISVDAAMSAMSESMAESLKEVAKQQIKYLTSVEQMLEAMLILEGIGSIDLSMTFSFQGNEYQLKDVYNVWKDLDEQGKKELEVVLKTALEGQGEGGQMIIDAIWGDGDGMDFLEAGMLSFFGGKADWLATPEGQTFMTSLGGLTEGLALDMASILSDEDYSQYFNEQGTGFADGMMDAFFAQYFSDLTGVDFNSLRENASIQLSQLLAQSGGTMELDMGENSITLTGMDGNNLQFAEGTNITEGMMEQLTQSLQTAMGREGMELSLSNGAVTVINGGTALSNASEGAQQINENFATAAEAATELNTAITNITSAVSSFQAGTGFQTLANQLGNAAGAAQALVAALYSMGALNFGNMSPFGLPNGANQQPSPQNLSYRPYTPEQQPSNTPPFTSGEVVRDDGKKVTMQGVVEITEADAKSLPEPKIEATADITNTDTSNVEQPVVEAQGKITYESDSEAPEGPELEDVEVNTTYNIEQEGTVPPLDDKESEITYNIEQNGSAPPMGDGEYTVKYNIITNGSGPAFTGTMNAITGPAYADGSIGRIYSGAQLANKTLVGELGPELAVYNGQYHLLGQTGAEFVKLPKSAIVFNHLQTRGILSGQMKDARGLPMEPTAFATGNVTGPALAGGSGIGAALSAVRRAKSVWQGLLNSLSAADLMGGGGGGGGGGGDENSLKAHIADLQEWYNLSRQIADIEGQINVLLAKRKNITDGHEYLRNLRETQRLLDDQVNTQQDLLRFQQLQLQRQAEHINTNKIWSQFLEVDENGLLQYKKGNETNGGKGALEVLSQMNEMSGEEQLAFVQSLGWSYTNTDGEELENEELVAKFYEELQKQIDDYDALRDTVQETEGTLADLEEQINEIEKEIRDNEIDLSKEIYDIIVDAWEENIANLKEQNDLIKEANEAYANGIQEAIDAERQLYEQNTAISDREQLQRQLALMRRSGGSASEIADLEQQLDDMLKEEYFSNQEKQLETIQKANERQVELMDQQVKLQEEALEYEKENGVIWTKVYEVMQGTDAEILDFMQGNKTDFFEQSALQQEDMLTEWAKKIGIYTEERQRQNYAAEAAKTFGNVWNNETGRGLQDAYNRAGSAQQEEWKREYNDTYASKMLEGKSHEEALALAQEEFYEHIRNWIKAEEDKKKQQQQQSSNNSSNNSSNAGSSNNKNSDTKYYYVKVGDDFIGVNSNDKKSAEVYIAKKAAAAGYTAEQVANSKSNVDKKKVTSKMTSAATGDLVKEDGAKYILHKGEGVFTADETSALMELVKNYRYLSKNPLSGLLSSIKTSYGDVFRNIATNNNPSDRINIESGAVVLQVQQLNDKYDVDELFNDVTDRLYSIAARASGRGVSRR